VAAGSVLFKDLHRRFCEKTPSRDELNFALRMHNISLSGNASVVGWLADPQPLCFSWTAKPGSQLQWCTHALLGSGADHFMKSILAVHRVVHDDNFTPTELARFVAITKATSILGNELGPADTLKNNYGYCIEVATWNGEYSEFEPSLTSTFCNVLIGPDDRNQIQPVSMRIYRHHALRDTIGPDGSVGRHVYVDFATGLHDDCTDIELPNSTLEPNSPIYCFGFAWTESTTKKTGLLNLTVDASKVQIEGNKTKFNLQLRDSAWLFKSLREFIASS